jgi:hypothetical protein
MPSHESPFVVLHQSHFIQTQFTRITLHITYTCFSPAPIHISSLLHQIPPLHKYQTNIIYPAPFRSRQQPYKRHQDYSYYTPHVQIGLTIRVIPEIPTHETGKEWTAEVLKEWLANKNRDLRKREGAGVGAGGRGRR